jgi:PBP1b-binding outer membrane lipoprotein LpoB
MTNAKSFKRLAACLLTVVMLVSCFATMGVAAADDSIDGKVAAIRFTNLTLNGNIGLNFYFEMEEFVLADEDAYVSFTVNGEETKILVKDAYQKTLDGDVNGVVYEIVTCELEPTQMTEQVMVKVVSGEKTSATYSYSIYDYATALLASVGDNADYAEAKALIEAMLHYGANAQLCFNYNVEDLANKDLSAEDLESVTAKTFKYNKVSGDMGIDGVGAFASANLLLESETTLKFYFRANVGVDVNTLTFKVHGKVVEATQQGEYLVVAIANIKAAELDTTHRVQVTCGGEKATFVYSVFTYAYNVLSAETGVYTPELVNTLKAMYFYNLEAQAYTK